MSDQTGMVGIEAQDRMNRFRRLAAAQGTQPPTVDQIILPEGSVSFIQAPVPVVRVVFDERVFFDFNSDQPRPEAYHILDLMAQNMQRDVPDAALTVLGHTDAIGSDAYNLDLSQRRAGMVMQLLAQRGVRISQLSTVAIGKRQPIAPNDTDEGRARNRRVEFLISASREANLSAIAQRKIPASFLMVGGPDPISLSQLDRPAKIMTLQEAPRVAGTPASIDRTGTAVPAFLLVPQGSLRIQRPFDQTTTRQTPETPAVAEPSNPVVPVVVEPPRITPVTPEDSQPIRLATPEPVQKRSLTDQNVHY